MSLFNHRYRKGPWNGAPSWAIELGEMQAITVAQNEAILAELQKRPNKLSPEDQEVMNKIFEKATASSAKIDAYVSDKA